MLITLSVLVKMISMSTKRKGIGGEFQILYELVAAFLVAEKLQFSESKIWVKYVFF